MICRKEQLGEVCYDCVHSWLRRNFGKASKCEHCGTKTAKRYDWCLKRGVEHEKKRDNYIELCVSCHRKYDWNDSKKINLTHLGFKHSDTTRKVMSEKKKDFWKKHQIVSIN